MPTPRGPRIPFAAKLAYTAWMLVWVPVYWASNGPSNFLWICDFALFAILWALWAESALVSSSQLVGVLLIQVVWAVDFLGRLVTGWPMLGATAYMFESDKPLWLRAFSLFHLWTVPLLVWMVRRLGHDRRGWRLQAGIVAILLPAGQWLGTPEQNLNWMWVPFGLDPGWMPPALFPLIALPAIVVYQLLPTEWFVRRWVAKEPGQLS